jgi:hypothetical protein
MVGGGAAALQYGFSSSSTKMAGFLTALTPQHEKIRKFLLNTGTKIFLV